jgi:hypothetical protein
MFELPRRRIDDPAEDAARLLSRFGIFLLFVVSLIAPLLLGQTIYVLLPVGAALLLAGAALSQTDRDVEPRKRIFLSPPAIGALFLICWTALSLSWSPFAQGPGERFAKSAATAALVAIACGFLPTRTKTSNLNLLPIGVGASALGLIAVVYSLGRAPPVAFHDVHPLGRIGVAVALLVWPAMGALSVRGRWGFAAALAAAAVVACHLSRAPHILPALLVGAAVFAVSFGRARLVAPALGWAGAIFVLASPLLALAVHLLFERHAPGLLRSYDLWGRIVAGDGWRVLLGHGFGAAHYGVFGGYLDPWTPSTLVFEVWFDLGVIGALAFAGVTRRTFRGLGALRPALAPFLLGGLATGLAICVMGPAAEQLWWVTLSGLDAIAYVLVIRGQFRKRRPMAPVSWGTSAPG